MTTYTTEIVDLRPTDTTYRKDHDMEPTFATWLAQQFNRDDPVGDVARDVAADRSLGFEAVTPDRLRAVGAPEEIVDAAEAEWLAHRD